MGKIKTVTIIENKFKFNWRASHTMLSAGFFVAVFLNFLLIFPPTIDQATDISLYITFFVSLFIATVGGFGAGEEIEVEREVKIKN